ncbi:MAG: hypothetical protein H7A51_15810 [Akkermansiaceae bacterium]|nr:hypothetical protein [Akkermansiaceae bacterium]
MKEENPEPAPSAALPDLQQSLLDPATLEQLFIDLGALTEITEIIPKAAAEGYVPEHTRITLDEAKDLLLSGSIRGLQIRYNYQGSQWWDTLLPAPHGEGHRIVRIEHNFG